MTTNDFGFFGKLGSTAQCHRTTTTNHVVAAVVESEAVVSIYTHGEINK